MMDIDVDFDLDFGDRVKDFLELQLKEIKSNNASLEDKIKGRKQHLSEINQTGNIIQEESLCSISLRWKKCFNKKYVLCYEIQNNCEKQLDHIKPFLCWSSSKQLTYESTIYNVAIEENKECLTCEHITNNLTNSTFLISKGLIVIVFNIPDYVDKLEYDIFGRVLGKHEDKEVVINLPSVKISAQDISDREVCGVSLTMTGDEDNLLTALAAAIKTDLAFIFPSDWAISMDSTFEIHCSLTKINILNTCKTYMTANRISPAFDDTVLSIQNSKTGSTIWATVYSSSTDAMLSLLHHLHQHISGLIVIPKELYENYEIKNCVNSASVSEVLREFQECINKEIELIESSTRRKTVKDFRSKLAALERNTDFLYLKICELNRYNTNY